MPARIFVQNVYMRDPVPSLHRLRSLLRNLVRRRDTERRLDDELRAYVELLVDEGVRAGMSPADARRDALLEIGGVDVVKDAVRDARAGARIEAIARDARHALRGLARTPGFTLAVVATLAIGIGLNTALFTLIYSVIARPLPVRDAHRIVNVYQRIRSTGGKGREVRGNTSFISYSEFQAYRASPAFDAAAVYFPEDLTVASIPNAQLHSELASCDYFRTLNVRFALGRGFANDDCATVGSGPVVVLSDATWRAEFGAEPHVVGRVAIVNGSPFTIIGVSEPGFAGIGIERAALWVPITMQPALEHGRDSILVRPNASWLVMVAHLSRGASIDQARAQVAVTARRLDAATAGRLITTSVVRGAYVNFPEVSGEGRLPIAMTLLLGFTIIAIACANVMNLLVARGIARRREIAIRLAIGASRRQLVQQLLIESALLATAGALIGLAFTAALPGIMALLSPIQAQVDVSPDAHVVVYALCVAIVATMLVGLTPALQTTQVDLVSAFKGASVFGLGQRKPSRLRNAVIAFQLGASALLLVTAGLFLRGAQRATSADPGFITHDVVAFSTNASSLGYDDARAAALYRALVDRIRATPGVVDVALAARLPLLARTTSGIQLDGAASQRPAGVVEAATVSRSYFNTLGIPILRGAPLDTVTAADGSRQAVASAAMAESIWPGEEAIGRRFRANGHWYHVVGIAKNASASSLATRDVAVAYLATSSPLDMQIIARTDGSAATLMSAVPGWAQQEDRRLVVRSEALEKRLAIVLLPARLIAGTTLTLGALALVLAAIGVAGIVSFTLGQRRREVAVRLAVGASGAQVVTLMMRQGTTPVIVGVTCGALVAALLGRLLRGFLFGLSPLDPVGYGAMIGVLALTGLLATYLPSRSAASVDPASVLRDDG